MKYLKKYILLLFALTFIALGAVLPYFTSQIQDAQINELQVQSEFQIFCNLLKMLTTRHLMQLKKNDIRCTKKSPN